MPWEVWPFFEVAAPEHHQRSRPGHCKPSTLVPRRFSLSEQATLIRVRDNPGYRFPDPRLRTSFLAPEGRAQAAVGLPGMHGVENSG